MWVCESAGLSLLASVCPSVCPCVWQLCLSLVGVWSQSGLHKFSVLAAVFSMVLLAFGLALLTYSSQSLAKHPNMVVAGSGASVGDLYENIARRQAQEADHGESKLDVGERYMEAARQQVHASGEL